MYYWSGGICRSTKSFFTVLTKIVAMRQPENGNKVGGDFLEQCER